MIIQSMTTTTQHFREVSSHSHFSQTFFKPCYSTEEAFVFSNLWDNYSCPVPCSEAVQSAQNIPAAGLCLVSNLQLIQQRVLESQHRLILTSLTRIKPFNVKNVFFLFAEKWLRVNDSWVVKILSVTPSNPDCYSLFIQGSWHQIQVRHTAEVPLSRILNQLRGCWPTSFLRINQARHYIVLSYIKGTWGGENAEWFWGIRSYVLCHCITLTTAIGAVLVSCQSKAYGKPHTHSLLSIRVFPSLVDLLLDISLSYLHCSCMCTSTCGQTIWIRLILFDLKVHYATFLWAYKQTKTQSFRYKK